jgi:hypothetical protein
MGRSRYVCDAGHLYQSHLLAGDNLNLTFWYSALTSKFWLSCYGWCAGTADGLPGRTHSLNNSLATAGEIAFHMVRANLGGICFHAF